MEGRGGGLPGCGSQEKSPDEKIWWPYASTMRVTRAVRSMEWSARRLRSVTLKASMNSMRNTLLDTRPAMGLGTMTSMPALAMFWRTWRRLLAS